MIRVKNVGLHYAEGPEVLNNISFTLAAGSFHFLTGRCGAGKSTLLRMLYLGHRPSRGVMEMFGRDISQLDASELPEMRRRIGVIFQDFRLVSHLSVFENVALPLAIEGRAEQDYRRDVEELLDWVGLGDKLHHYPELLSGGEQQQVAIARAVVASPQLLLADEPTGSVDAKIGERLLGLLIELNRQGATLLIATHDTGLLERHRHHAGELQLEEGGLLRQLPPVRVKASG
ncbi:MAG: cell division ATP-binding protein FtsE [Pseudomonadota bacterium]